MDHPHIHPSQMRKKHRDSFNILIKYWVHLTILNTSLHLAFWIGSNSGNTGTNIP